MQISIIVPHYNDFDGLSCLLESIPVFNDLEVIVVDDKSQDRARLISIKKAFTHVKFIENTSIVKNAGVSRNIGLKEAQGEWVLFADSDDFFIEEAFSYIDHKLKQVKQNIDVIYFSPTSVYLDSGQLADRHSQYKNLVKKHINKSDESIRYEFYPPWSKAIRKELLDKHDIWFDEVIASNDVMFSLKSGYFARDIIADDKVVYCVTRRAGSLTTTYNKKVMRSRLNVKYSYLNFLNQYCQRKSSSSFLWLLIKFYKVITIKDIIILFKLSMTGVIRFWPNFIIKYQEKFRSRLLK